VKNPPRFAVVAEFQDLVVAGHPEGRSLTPGLGPVKM
jgi:hypothetical protein